MNAFLQQFGSVVRGVLSGFDRLFFRGTLRNLSYPDGLRHYLWRTRVLHKDFKQHSREVSQRLEEASTREAREQGREIRYLNSCKISPEEVAKEIAARDGIRDGLICVLRRVEPCMSFEIHGSRRTQKLEITYRERQGMHLYHYQIHPVFGFMHARIQTWFPFRITVCINGHEWLARQMDQAGLAYQQRDNCFPWVEDVAKAQELFNHQLQANWPNLLNDFAAALNPIHDTIFERYPTQYYWSVAQSEWSSDVLFRSREALQAIYPRLIRHAITTYGAADILRFLGRKLRLTGRVPAGFAGEVESNLKDREEGVRIKHWLNGNSLKLYDKYSVLRPETTIYNPLDFRVFRPKEGEPEGPRDWRRLRWGVADLFRRAEVCQAANERYLDALAAVPDTTPLRTWVEPLCRPVLEPRKAPPLLPPAVEATAMTAPEGTPVPPEVATASVPPANAATGPSGRVPGDGLIGAAAASAEHPPTESSPSIPPTPSTRRRRLRALNPLSADDSNLLEAVGRPEFLLNGLRNRDIRRLLFPTEPHDKADERRRAAAISRKLRLLRAHGLIRKVPRTHRYLVSPNGRKVITALLAARDANVDFLTTNAA
jgi:hypothetical protein